MEGEEVMNGEVSNGGVVVSCENGLEQEYNDNGMVQGDAVENVNLAEEVLENLEEYWDDISDRLMISRVVSDSLIKGMVTAVEQDAAESIAAKEMEVANLKERLQSLEVGNDKYDDMPVVQKAYEIEKSGICSCSTDSCTKHEKMREDLNALRNLVREQFKRVNKEIEFARGSNSLKKIGSSSELVGLGGILHEKQPESWMHVNRMLDSLKTAMDTVCRKVDDLLISSNISSCKSQQNLCSLATVEDVGIQTEISSLQNEFEENLLEPNAQFCGIQNKKWLEKFNDISSLGTKLDAILKSLSMSETELVSHGSRDFERLHHKAFGNHVTIPTTLNGENETVDASIIHVAESYEFHQLKHMNNKELVDYFNDIITKIKRDHESALHHRTEEYFRLKREFLKEKGYSMTHRKDEEFDVLRKEIPKVILKLENFLSENEKFPLFTNKLSMGKLKHRPEILLSENRDLRDCLAEKENEVKILEMQVSHTAEELSQHSVAEENMLNLVRNLKSAVEDSRIEASLNEEIYRCALREQIAQTRCDSENSYMELLMTQEVHDAILQEAAIPSETSNRYGIDDSDIESSIVQELDGLILTEAIRDARQRVDSLCPKVLIDDERRICLETKVVEKEEELRLEVGEQEKLKQEVLGLRTTVEQKEKLAMDLSVQLSKVREQYELASQELISLKEHASHLKSLVSKGNKEIESLRSQYLEAFEQTEVLNEQLDQTKAVAAEANSEKDKVFTLAQQMHDKLLLSEAREQTLIKEMEMAADGFSKICEDFECRVSGAIKSNSLRLEATSSNMKALTEMATLLRKTGLIYKSKLERKCTDLHMAESEVDLLGDEVDALLKLLGNIYTALDHYSPVLKHYPGIIEILKLVRRELTGESTLQADQIHGKDERKFPRSQIC
ncbi:hypothetical protein ACS0TY_018059 [Phlomoides rotata]